LEKFKNTTGELIPKPLTFVKPFFMRSKRLIWISFPFLLLAGIYFLGSQPETPAFSKDLPVVPSDSENLEKYVAARESLHKLKPHNEAQIIWNDSTKTKTPYSVLYLHGFSASQMEGDPVHRDFAKEFGCNLYLSRLADHGVDTTEALLYFTADRFWETAKEGLAIAKQLGNKVIILSTSTGSTVALKLAADYPDDVHALINLSPNIAINNGAAFLLNNPWGLQIARQVMGGKYRVKDPDPNSEEHGRFWNNTYRLEAAVQLQELLEETMTPETFKRVTQPCLTLYYYKNESEQDPEVRVDAMLKMHQELGTPDDMKVAVAIPDAGAHVIGSSLTSKAVPAVYAEIEKFALEKLKLEKR
jgi:pimeloyl-ACP methyl ester carboxylesterase